MRKLHLLDVQAVVLFSLGMFGFGLALTIERIAGLPERILTVPYRFLVLLCSLAMIGVIVLKGRRFVSRAYLLPLLFFWAAYTARFIVDAYIHELPMAHQSDELLFYLFGMCFIPMMALLLYSSAQFMSSAVGASLLTLSLTCIAVLLFSHEILQTDFKRLRADGGLNPITLGHLGVSLVTLSLFLIFSRQPIIQIPKVVLTFLIGFGLLVVGLASSRGPVLALFVLFPLILFFALRQGKKLRTLLVIAVGVLCIPFGVMTVTRLGSNIDQRIIGTIDQAASGTESRMDLWKSAWEDFLDHPLTGRAFEGQYGTYPHNLVIESFMATGVFGGCGFLWLLLVGLRAALRLISREAEYAWIGLLFVQMVVYALFSGALWSHFGFWYMLAAVLVYGEGPCVTLSLSPARWQGWSRPGLQSVR